MISLQGFVLRTLLSLRKATINWDASAEAFRANLKLSNRFVRVPRHLEVQRDRVDGVSVEWIIPPNATSSSTLFYIHGGAWIMGWTNLHQRMVASVCQAGAIRALAVDYRLAPEHPFPAALEDCLTAYRWLLKNGITSQDIVIAGDSAGANLTLATLMSLRDAGTPLPVAAVCISPMTDLTGTGDSFQKNQDPALTARFALRMARLYAGDQELRSPLLSPHYGNLRGLPPLLIHVGGDEILLSDAVRLADNARATGVDVNLVVWPKMWHVWHLFLPFLPEARRAIHAVSNFIVEHVSRKGQMNTLAQTMP